MNETLIVTVFVVIDDIMQAAGHQTHTLARVSDAEVLTVAVVAAAAFGNHHARALLLLRRLLLRLGYLSGRLSVSRFNRRLHALSDWLVGILDLIAALFVAREVAFVVDSLPVPVCERVRARRCTKVSGRRYYGYCSAKRLFFYGFRLHLLTTPEGIPVNVALWPASFADLTPVHDLLVVLPGQTCAYADKAYNSRMDEASILAETGVTLVPIRKKNQPPNTWQERQQLFPLRARIETVGSQLTAMGINRLHARTLAGYEITVLASLVALAWTNIIANAIPLAQSLLRPY